MHSNVLEVSILVARVPCGEGGPMSAIRRKNVRAEVGSMPSQLCFCNVWGRALSDCSCSWRFMVVAAVLPSNKFLSRETSVNVTRKPSCAEPLDKGKGSLSTQEKGQPQRYLTAQPRLKGVRSLEWLALETTYNARISVTEKMENKGANSFIL